MDTQTTTARKTPGVKYSACPCGHDRYSYRIQGTTLIRRSRFSTGHLHRMGGWALDAIIWNAHREQIERFVIQDVESGNTWSVEAWAFDAYKVTHMNGSEPQYALPDRYWEVKRPDGSVIQRDLTPKEQMPLPLVWGATE